MKYFYLLIGLFSVGSAFALNYEDQIGIQSSLESRLTPLVHLFDKNAIVMVKFRLKNKYEMPGETPYVLNELATEYDVQEKVIERIDITLLTNKIELPKSIAKIIADAASGVAPKVSIRTQLLPEVPVSAAVESEVESPKVEKPLSLFELISNEMNSLHGVSTGLLIFILIFSTGLWNVFGLLKQSAGSLSHNLERVANAIEVQTALPVEQPTITVVTERDAGFREMFASLPKNGLGSLLADCYWGELDSYASFIWKRCTLDKKRELTGEFGFLNDYSTYLEGVVQANLNAEQEACYLNPLSITHLDNTKLTELVTKTPGLLFKLSLLRRTSLLLSANEKVELTRLALKQPLIAIPDFTKLVSSPKRALPSRHRMAFKGTSEELEILNMATLPTELRANIPSLGWVTKLPELTVIKLLQSYTARELASAWAGPEEILAKLRELMPKPKQELLNAYLLRIKPDRNSPVFQSLQNQALQCLEGNAFAERKEIVQSKVA